MDGQISVAAVDEIFVRIDVAHVLIAAGRIQPLFRRAESDCGRTVGLQIVGEFGIPGDRGKHRTKLSCFERRIICPDTCRPNSRIPHGDSTNTRRLSALQCCIHFRRSGRGVDVTLSPSQTVIEPRIRKATSRPEPAAWPARHVVAGGRNDVSAS